MRRPLKWILGAAFAFAALFVLSNWWIVSRAHGHIHRSASTAKPSRVAIILGAATWGNQPSATLADRLHCGLTLYRSGKVRHILVSGDNGSKDYDEVRSMKNWLIRNGVPAARVYKDHAGFRTLDSMERAKRIFGVERAIVCTQGFHQPRALFLARRAGIEASGVVSDRRVYAAATYNQWRERLARMLALVDSYVLNREPRFLGEPEAQLK